MMTLPPDSFLWSLIALLAGALLIGSGAPMSAAAQGPTSGNAETGDCFFDPDQDPVSDVEALVRDDDPYKGTADAPVTVIEFFDPNCPHCKTAHEMMADVIASHEDEARFVYKPMPLWEYSLPQIEALYLAKEEGKFEDMLDAQYEHQQQGGLSMAQLQQLAAEIEMDPDAFAERMQEPTYLERILEQREEAVDIGVESTPTILVNDRFVHPQSRNAECMSAFIEEAAE